MKRKKDTKVRADAASAGHEEESRDGGDELAMMRRRLPRLRPSAGSF